jgi:hypothetical protein
MYNIVQSGLPFYWKTHFIFCANHTHTILDENHVDIYHVCEICEKRVKAVKSVMLILYCLSFLFFAVTGMRNCFW